MTAHLFGIQHPVVVSRSGPRQNGLDPATGVKLHNNVAVHDHNEKGLACPQKTYRRPRKAHALEHDPEKWIPVFGKRSCSKKKLERDDDSKKSHHALGPKSVLSLFVTLILAELDCLAVLHSPDVHFRKRCG